MELRAAGYTILSGAAETEADAFSKVAGSLFVFFQGHPEYEDITLLKEYRRDVGRSARGDQDRYPDLPHGYFSRDAEQLLEEFRAGVLSGKVADPYAAFPTERVATGLESTWRPGAIQIYRNWLSLVAASKKKRSESTLQARDTTV
jgi:homoserine O-succinyltransferase